MNKNKTAAAIKERINEINKQTSKTQPNKQVIKQMHD